MTITTEQRTTEQADRSAITAPSPDAPLKQRVLHHMKARGIAEVTVCFDGGGDSGQIENIDYQGLVPGLDLDKLTLPGNERVTGHEWDSGVRINRPVDRPKTLYDLIEEYAYEVLEGVPVDWVNNDGGYGEVVIHVDDDELDGGITIVQMNARVTTSEYSEHQY